MEKLNIMRLNSAISALLLITLLTYAISPSFGQGKKGKYLTPGQKSIHLFNLPEGVTEAQLIASLSELNEAIQGIGYKGVGYHLYKVEDNTIQAHRYFVEGLWPDPETYRTIHDHEAWKQAAEKNNSIWDKIQAVEIYRRVVKIDVNN